MYSRPRRQNRASPSKEKEGPLSPTRFATAFANLLLAATSAYALRQTGGFGLQASPATWASTVTFSFFLFHAIIGIIRFGNPQYGDALRSAYENTTFWCVVIALPFFSAQISIMYSLPTGFGLSFIFLGFATVGLHYVSRIYLNGKNNGEARWAESFRVKFVVSINLFTIVALCYVNLNFYGVAASLSFLHNFFFTGLTGTVFNIPAVDLFVYQLAFFNLFAVKALLD
ncbi:uncharacterized protein LOC117642173 [Thrips palmi]|uniref:Uncharacterized protein LOC117642173 n=1 Tax=Thrips palmi TaxID=161013 RepID=A0A6P8Y8M3_THRPL|nr:uncharacterized protein LOC117642173 [Thrips palmi]